MLMINRTIIALSQKIGKLLPTKNWQMVTVESCTGGGLSYALTKIAGSSAWLKGGWVTYTNDAKYDWLGVAKDLLAKYTAVSAQVAQAMAEGALQRSETDIAISVTGIAGPSGGSKTIPVGTVWFGIASKHFITQTFLFHFTGSRMQIRQQAIERGLELLYHQIAEN